MYCIVLDRKIADKNVTRKLGVFLGMFRDTLSVLQKQQTTKQALWCKRIFHGIVWNNGGLNSNEQQNILPKEKKAQRFAKETEKSKHLSNLRDKEVEDLIDHGFPKNQQLVESDKQM